MEESVALVVYESEEEIHEMNNVIADAGLVRRIYLCRRNRRRSLRRGSCSRAFQVPLDALVACRPSDTVTFALAQPAL